MQLTMFVEVMSYISACKHADKVENWRCSNYKLTFSFLITNVAAPLGSCLSSLRPPSRLRLVVPWYSCWLIRDGDDGSAEFQLQTTRAVSACKCTKRKFAVKHCGGCRHGTPIRWMNCYLNIEILIVTRSEAPGELQDGVSTVFFPTHQVPILTCINGR